MTKIINEHLLGTDYNKLLDVFNNKLSDEISIRNLGGKLEIEQIQSDDRFNIIIRSESVGFCFTNEGNFLGMYNWRERD